MSLFPAVRIAAYCYPLCRFLINSSGHYLIKPVTFFLRNSPQWARASSFLRFLDLTQQRTTVSRTPLEERSARRRDLYLTPHNTQKRKKFMPPVGFEPTISASERPQSYALGRAATGTGKPVALMCDISHGLRVIFGQRAQGLCQRSCLCCTAFYRSYC